jgi:hypothetical protein
MRVILLTILMAVSGSGLGLESAAAREGARKPKAAGQDSVLRIPRVSRQPTLDEIVRQSEMVSKVRPSRRSGKAKRDSAVRQAEVAEGRADTAKSVDTTAPKPKQPTASEPDSLSTRLGDIDQRIRSIERELSVWSVHPPLEMGRPSPASQGAPSPPGPTTGDRLGASRPRGPGAEDEGIPTPRDVVRASASATPAPAEPRSSAAYSSPSPPTLMPITLAAVRRPPAVPGRKHSTQSSRPLDPTLAQSRRVPPQAQAGGSIVPAKSRARPGPSSFDSPGQTGPAATPSRLAAPGQPPGGGSARAPRPEHERLVLWVTTSCAAIPIVWTGVGVLRERRGRRHPGDGHHGRDEAPDDEEV